MVMLDANMILRYLLNDNQEMADRAESYLEDGDVIVTIDTNLNLNFNIFTASFPPCLR